MNCRSRIKYLYVIGDRYLCVKQSNLFDGNKFFEMEL